MNNQAISKTGSRSTIVVLSAAIGVLIVASVIALLNNSDSFIVKYAMAGLCSILALAFGHTLFFRVPINICVDDDRIVVRYCVCTQVIQWGSVQEWRQEVLPARGGQRRLILLCNSGQHLVVSSRSFGPNYDSIVTEIVDSLNKFSSLKQTA